MRPDNNFCLFLFCQLDFQDNCEDSPCGEGSRCLDSYFVYYCDCKQGYAGDQCQIGRYILLNILPCDNNFLEEKKLFSYSFNY